MGQQESPLEDVALYLSRSHSRPKALLFIDPTLKLKELQKLYFELRLRGDQTAMIATKMVPEEGYQVFTDDIRIWYNDVEKERSHVTRAYGVISMPPPPPPIKIYTSRDSYLATGAEIQYVRSGNEVNKLREGKYPDTITLTLAFGIFRPSLAPKSLADAMASPTFFGTNENQNLPEIKCQDNYVRVLIRPGYNLVLVNNEMPVPDYLQLKSAISELRSKSVFLFAEIVEPEDAIWSLE